ncbi:hypothetical protein [Paenibacillus sp. BIC5C1]|uniref:hypothetical protein n=1 Tax=Paenibacillus sp. BIC5C1 TaxID=3078263 RepID=UPI0028F0F075|nr:hypothetical protein [Paenibacillus sp. BIC5C1]
MMTLGIRPVGAELTIIRHQIVYRNQLQYIQDVGVINNASVIAGLEPDLIVYEHRSDAMRELLEQVAPTRTINPASNTAEQLRCIAKNVGEEQKAEQWIVHASVRTHTYTTNAKWNFDDPITRDRLLKVMPRILKHPLT